MIYIEQVELMKSLDINFTAGLSSIPDPVLNGNAVYLPVSFWDFFLHIVPLRPLYQFPAGQTGEHG